MLLPNWLDNFIYNDLNAKYCRSNANITVIDWDKNDILNYLGTYFPRSYAEAYCIFTEYFQNNTDTFADKEELTIFDFGCGTGGEIIGLLTVLNELRPNLKIVKIVALDGNQNALRLYDKVITELQNHIDFCIENDTALVPIGDFYDLHILDDVIDKQFDVIISFKAICEFVTKDQFEKHNAYEHIVKFLTPKLVKDGLLLLVDVTSYNDTSQEWLPNMMDKGLSATKSFVTAKNRGNNQTFLITHSHKLNDCSKVAWRMIKK